MKWLLQQSFLYQIIFNLKQNFYHNVKKINDT